MEQLPQKPDFRIYTASLVPVGDTAPTTVRMTGSSTEMDVQRNRMSTGALKDMAQPSLVGMNIFLNHKYELPHDLYGKLIAAPEIASADGFLDVNLLVDTDIKNPPAAQTLQQIQDGHKHGCSVGCMVNKWTFAEEDDDPARDPIVIQSVTPIEWSVVGIPANRRCWVENAVQGKFLRTLDEGDYDQALQLAPTVKSLFSYDYDRAVLRLSATERRAFEAIKPRQTPDKQLFWQPQRSVFVMQSGNGQYRDLSRSEVVEMLHASHEQSIIGGRIKRRQAALGGGSSSTKDGTSDMLKKLVAADGDTFTPDQLEGVELIDEHGTVIPLIQLDAANYHEPFNGLHSHDHSHGPGEASHSHVHKHGNTNSHFHDHTGNMDGDGGAPDGDGDQDDWNDPDGASSSQTQRSVTPDVTLAAQGDGTAVNTAGDGTAAAYTNPPASRPGGGSGAAPVPAPNNAGGNTGRANNSGSSNTSPTGNPPNTTGGKVASVPVGTDQEPSSVIGGTPHRAAARDLDLLEMYNNLGKKLGLGTVDENGLRNDGISMTVEDAPQHMADYLNSLKSQGLQLIHAADSVALQLGVRMPYLTFKVEPDLELAGKGRVATPLDVAHAVHVQSIASHASAVLASSGYATQSVAPDATASAGTTITADANAEVKKQLAAAEQRVLLLNQQMDQLSGRGLGRPTTFTGRSAPMGFDSQPFQVEAKTSEELHKGTFIVKRGDDVKCRQWPAGHGLHQRPELSTSQMSIMTVSDVDRYYAGQDVMVPMIFEGD